MIAEGDAGSDAYLSDLARLTADYVKEKSKIAKNAEGIIVCIFQGGWLKCFYGDESPIGTFMLSEKVKGGMGAYILDFASRKRELNSSISLIVEVLFNPERKKELTW